MALQTFNLLSVQSGPLQDGGNYRSIWVQPVEWEDRGAPHITRGPVPMKIDCSPEVIDSVLTSGIPLPAPFDLDIGVKVASGNKSKGFVFSAVPVVESVVDVVDDKSSDLNDDKKLPGASKDAKNDFLKGK